jgi:hypothetical protein|tara:strand:+ start:127 stop:327 length:201 start_codon:yes stop_codon:yes gene_type:complete
MEETTRKTGLGHLLILIDNLLWTEKSEIPTKKKKKMLRQLYNDLDNIEIEVDKETIEFLENKFQLL